MTTSVIFIQKSRKIFSLIECPNFKDCESDQGSASGTGSPGSCSPGPGNLELGLGDWKFSGTRFRSRADPWVGLVLVRNPGNWRTSTFIQMIQICAKQSLGLFKRGPNYFLTSILISIARYHSSAVRIYSTQNITWNTLWLPWFIKPKRIWKFLHISMS